MRKIRVLYTIPNFDTAGSGKALLNLALGLNREKFEAHILCEHNRGNLFKTVEQSGIPVHVFPYLTPARPYPNLIRNCYRLAHQLKDLNVDVIHSFNYSADYSEGLTAWMANIPWTFTKKSMSWGGSSANAWKVRSLLARKIVLQNTDMQTEFYPNSHKTVLIPRGVDTQLYTPALPDPAIRTAMHTAPEKRILICVANFVPVKGIELLFQAFGELHHTYADWSLWLVGDDQNEYGKKLHELVETSPAKNNIHFSGKQPDVTAYLNHAEVFVLPTRDEGRREGSPVALLEAMSNGKVVVASRIAGIKDQLRAFPDHLFEAGNAADLKRILEPILRLDKTAMHIKGNQFLLHARQHYPIEQEIKQHEALYTSMLQLD